MKHYEVWEIAPTGNAYLLDETGHLSSSPYDRWTTRIKREAIKKRNEMRKLHPGCRIEAVRIEAVE